MSDTLTKAKRSWNMSRVKGKDTKFEILVRKYLFAKGFRFRKNDARYPGKPDIVLPKYNTVIFINGCFWHGHKGCKKAAIPKSNTEFWQRKLHNNVVNDQINNKLLCEKGWNVIVLWECELIKKFDFIMEQLIKKIEQK